MPSVSYDDDYDALKDELMVEKWHGCHGCEKKVVALHLLNDLKVFFEKLKGLF